MKDFLDTIRQQHHDAVDGFFAECGDGIAAMAIQVADALAGGKKILLCGNGGSACDAMHIAGEFVGRYVEDRKGLAAIALSADTGILTAIANDYDYNYIFARQVEALGQAGDVLIALSTSGKSPNVLRAIESAKQLGMATFLLTGRKALGLPAAANVTLMVPSVITAHVQEAHATALHAMTCLVEAQLFAK